MKKVHTTKSRMNRVRRRFKFLRDFEHADNDGKAKMLDDATEHAKERMRLSIEQSILSSFAALTKSDGAT